MRTLLSHRLSSSSILGWVLGVEEAMIAVCVFTGSSPGANPAYRAAADALGRALAGRGWELVYGGGHVGLMGVLADAALRAGGRVTGVIPRGLVEREVGHTGLTECLVVESMHERKAVMAERSDGFVVLPGGFGTLDETFEALTWAQLGLHTRPIVLLDVDGYWEPLRILVDRMVEQRFVREEHRALLNVCAGVEPALDLVAEPPRPAGVPKWRS